MSSVRSAKPHHKDRSVFLRSSPSRVYLVRVTSTSGEVIGEQVVKPAGNLSQVQVRLPDKHQPYAQSALVSMAELAHKITGRTMKEAREADKALKKKDFPSLIAHLEKVVAIDPEYIPARRNLSLAYLTMSQFEKAIESFQKLVALDVHTPMPYGGLSVAFYNLNRLAESEVAAQRALAINGSYELGHYLLGVTLAAQNKDTPRALRHLAQAIRRFPAAHITTAGILARLGHREEAKVQLQAYLDSGDASSRPEAEELLNKLY